LPKPLLLLFFAIWKHSVQGKGRCLRVLDVLIRG
jgi:hypothetical protein